MTEGSQEAVQVTWPPLVTAQRPSGLRPTVSLPGPRVATRQSLERPSGLSSCASGLSGCLVLLGGPAFVAAFGRAWPAMLRRSEWVLALLVDALCDPSTTSATSLDRLQGLPPGPPSSAAVPLTVVPSASAWLSSPGDCPFCSSDTTATRLLRHSCVTTPTDFPSLASPALTRPPSPLASTSTPTLAGLHRNWHFGFSSRLALTSEAATCTGSRCQTSLSSALL